MKPTYKNLEAALRMIDNWFINMGCEKCPKIYRRNGCDVQSAFSKPISSHFIKASKEAK